MHIALNAPCFRSLAYAAFPPLDYGVPVWLDGEIDIAPEETAAIAL